MSPRRLKELERSERRREVLRLVLRVIVIVVILFVAYYLLPGWALSGGASILSVVVSFLLFALVVVWLTRRIIRADLPELRAIEALATVAPLFIFLFASSYLAMSRASPAAFSEPLNHTGALYATITILSTVGFGDITPKTDIARIVVSVQMMLDLVLIGAVVRIVIGAAKVGLSRGSAPSESSGDSESSGQG